MTPFAKCFRSAFDYETYFYPKYLSIAIFKICFEGEKRMKFQSVSLEIDSMIIVVYME